MSEVKEDMRHVGISYSYRVYEQDSVAYDHANFLKWAKKTEETYTRKDIERYLWAVSIDSKAPLSELVTGTDWPNFCIQEILED